MTAPEDFAARCRLLAAAMCERELWAGAFEQASDAERHIWLRRAESPAQQLTEALTREAELSEANAELREARETLRIACSAAEAREAALVEALRRITGCDYRGNRPVEQSIAAAALEAHDGR